MYCPKCQKDLPADSAFCPYCGNEKLTEKAEPAAEEAATKSTAETVSETVTETAPKATAAPTTEASAPAPQGDRVVPGKSGKGIVIAVLCVFVVLAAIVAAFAVGYYVSRGEWLNPAVSTDAPETSTPVEDGDLFPDEYTSAYPDGFDYLNTDLSKYITLGKYKGVTVTLTTSSEVTDTEVREYIDELVASYATEEDVTDRPAAMGDTVVIDYVGTIDGVAFDGGTSSDESLTLGVGGYIDGFEDGIVGMNVGETKTIDVTFPDSYHNSDLAGKAAQFAITLDSISVSVVPEYNDTFVRENFEDFDTMVQFEAEVKAMLQSYREEEILAEKQDGVFSVAVDNATLLAYPEGLVEDYMYQQINYIKSYAAMYGMDYSELVEMVMGMEAAAYEAEVRASAEASVKQELVIAAIAKAENITPPEDALADAEAYYLSMYDAEDVTSMCDSLGISEDYFYNTINFSVLYTEVMDILTENATFTGAN